MTTEIPRRIYTADEWVEIKHPDDEWARDRLISRLPEGMPLYAMREIEDHQVYSIRMFSDEGWKELHKRCGDIAPGVDEETLADGFIDFQLIWIDDNELMIRIDEPDEVRRGIEIFYNEYTDEYVYWRRNGNKSLFNTLIDRWCDYLIRD